MPGLNVPGVGLVPILWKPSPDRNVGRSGYQPIAIVHHRAVTSNMESLDATLIGSTRQVSATFGIGHTKAGALEIHQYVDVSDTAWCNGIDPTLVPTNNWTSWGYGNHHHNARTVSIEHEDQGGSTDPTKKGIVREDGIKASIELDRILLTGDLAKIRATGIRIRDQATADALRKIVPGPRTLIDHHDIAAQQKPYCWKPWSADKVGFPRARYVTELTAAAPAPTPPLGSACPVSLLAYIPGQIATIKAGMNVRKTPDLDGVVIRVTAAVETWAVTGWVKGDVDPDGGTGRWLCRFDGGQWEYTSEANVATGPKVATSADTVTATTLKASLASAKTIAADAAAKIGAL